MVALLSLTVFTSVKIADDYYLFPIKPGDRNYLSGNFCELRGSHMHAGLDIKVGGVVGAPVHATANGYISRIKVSYGGYGNALYIQHPNGTTSVYAHLHEYGGKIQQYVKEAQYRNKSFTIELFPEKDELTVKRGQVIGKAGNSGSSGGPHLHFEIRDANQRPIDPLQFGFSEIVDKVAPYVRKVALVTLDKDARINGQFGRFEFALKTNGNRYFIEEPIEAQGNIGVEIAAYDKATNVRNIYGIKKSELFLDGASRFLCDIEKFSFSDSKNIHVHTNYEERYRQNRTFYRLYVADGNEFSFYETGPQQGKLIINDTQAHEASIELTDIHGNQSKVDFTLQGRASWPETLQVRYFSKPYTNRDYHVRGNVLQWYVPAEKNPEGLYERQKATIFANRRRYEEPPAYLVNNTAVYLWDLQQGLPDSLGIQGMTERLSIQMKVPSRRAFSFYQPYANITFPKSSLFDTLYLETEYGIEADREVFRIHKGSVPLRRSISVQLKPKQLPPGPKEKMAVYSVSNAGGLGYQGGTWKKDMITFSTRSFGDYVLAADTIPPVITPLSVGSDRLRFKIEDVLSGLKEYDVYVDGEWVLMHYDYKKNLIWSDRLDDSKSFRGEVKLVTKDNAGNENVFQAPIKS